LKKVELESILKSFILFFVSQLFLVSALFFVDYKKEIEVVDDTIFSQMRICSFDLSCQEYQIDFASADKHELYKLYKEKDALSAYFSIPNSTENILKIYLPISAYNKIIKELLWDFILKFIIVVFVILLLSIGFSIYTISPLRNALRLTEEFIKDILHDFNTPLSTLRLNAAMLKKELPKNKKIQRIEDSVGNILSLQSHLRSYLRNHTSQQESFNLSALLADRISLIEVNFKSIRFVMDVNTAISLRTNRDAFSRIIDNILSNAAKYNTKLGMVTLICKGGSLEIKDTGKGIKNPKRVFDRFYKEQERGIGIGLHIVQKLCDELKINIRLSSTVNTGTSFFLDLNNLVENRCDI